ncbi:hypothetical protein [Empedobacter tilapiae]
MKIFIFLIGIITVPNITCAQVGIGTSTPQGILHVDPKENSDGTLLTTNDDVIISTDGKIGIGTTNPTEKLHVEGKSFTTGNSKVGNQLNVKGKTLIKGKMAIGGTHMPTSTVHVATTANENTIRIEDTTFSSGKYLTSDKDGNAFWEGIAPATEVVGYDVPLYSSAKRISTNAPSHWTSSDLVYVNITDEPLNLTEGIWLIIARYGVRMNNSTNHKNYKLEDMIWTKLEQSFNGGATWTEVITEGMIGEIGDKGTGTTASNRMHSAIPQVTHILNVENTVQIRVQAGVICGNNSYYIQTVPENDTNTYMSGFKPVFVAVRLNNKSLGNDL